MTKYYLQRGDRVIGPFGLQKIEELLQAGKLEPSSQISESAKGPWKAVSDLQPRETSTFSGVAGQEVPTPVNNSELPNSPDPWGSVLAAPPPSTPFHIPPNNFWTPQTAPTTPVRRTTDPTDAEAYDASFIERCFCPWLGENNKTRYGNLDRYMQIFKLVSRVGFVLGLILLVLMLMGGLSAMVVADAPFEVKAGIVLYMLIGLPLFLVVLHLAYILNMALCDFLRLMMDIEANTRRRN